MGILRATVALALGGCNAIFGLDPTRLGADGATAPDADTTPADAYPAELTGTIYAFSASYQHAGVTIVGLGASALFGHPASTCTSPVFAGDCEAEQCTSPVDPGPWPDAGRVDIIGTSTVSMTPNPDGSYPYASSSVSTLFADGQQVSFTGAGGTIPAFTATFAAPVSVTFQPNALPAPGLPATLVRANGMDLTWPPASGLVVVAIVEGTSQMVCRFPAERGSGRLEPTTLATLPAGDAMMQSVVVTREDVVAGEYHLALVPEVCARRADGDWVDGPLTLQ